MSKETIKPCPHCGGSACLNSNFSYKTRKYFIFIKCDICGAQGKIYSSAEDPAAGEWNTPACTDAIGAWNMRTDPTEKTGG